MKISVKEVRLAILAVDVEARKRGEMYPQTADEQREDRAAVRRVCEMLEWYEHNTGCERIAGWPERAPSYADIALPVVLDTMHDFTVPRIPGNDPLTSLQTHMLDFCDEVRRMLTKAMEAGK